MTSHSAHRLSFREYLGAVREYRWLILVMGIVGFGASLAHARRQPVEFTAQTVVVFQAGGRSQNLDHGAPATLITPVELISLATTINRQDRMARVQRRLRTRVSTQELAAAVGANVNVRTGTLAIATWGRDPGLVTRLADAVGRDVVTAYNRRLRARVAFALRDARRKVERLRDRPTRDTLYQVSLQMARIELLRTQSRAVTVPTPAPAVAAAIVPRPRRSALLGLAFGLVAGVLTALVAATVDRRIRGESDAMAILDLPVLGRLAGTRLGAITGVDGGCADAAAAAEEYRRIRHGLELLDRRSRMRVVLVTSALPGEGKSTVAGSLAFFTAASGRRTLLLECDLRRPVLATRLGVPATPGLTELLAGEATLAEVVRTVSRSDLEPGAAEEPPGSGTGTVTCVPAGSPTSSAAELLGSMKFRALLRRLADDHQMVLLDGTPILPVADSLVLLPQVDGAILCARAMHSARNELLAVRAALENVPQRPMGVVLTGVRRRDERAVVPARRLVPRGLRSA